MPDHPFSCNLNNAEVFSCVLGSEDDYALSIIDPVTINLEIRNRNPGTSKGLVDISEDKEQWSRTAEIQLQQLNVRLSYYDALMFQAILESFPRQARQGYFRSVMFNWTSVHSRIRYTTVCIILYHRQELIDQCKYLGSLGSWGSAGGSYALSLLNWKSPYPVVNISIIKSYSKVILTWKFTIVPSR